MAEYKTYLVVHKRRFNCKNCLRWFTENNCINELNKSLANKLISKNIMRFKHI